MGDEPQCYSQLTEKELIDDLKRVLESAWVIIANAHGGNWELASDEWQDAAVRWRDRWLGMISPAITEIQEEEEE